MSDYQPEPYTITLAATTFGNRRVEVSADLCWANLFINGTCYECLGSSSPFWLQTHDNKGSMSTPLERVLQMIRLGRDPDKVPADQKKGQEAWLYGEGKGIVAGWRKAHALAKHFCEHPGDLQAALRDEVIRRWQGEKVPIRKHQLQTYIPHGYHGRLGIDTPTPLRTKGGDLRVPF